MPLSIRDNENENRFHAIEKIQKAMEYKNSYEGNRSDLYLLVGIINSLIYVGDGIKELINYKKDHEHYKDYITDEEEGI